MPLLNIGGITDNNITIQIAVCFVKQETEPVYDWPLYKLYYILEKGGIEEPRTIITDCEKALINSIAGHFPRTKYILYQWYISQNIKLKTKHMFPRLKLDPKTKRIVPNEKYQLFLDEWDELLYTPTIGEYNKYKESFTRAGKWPISAIEYTKSWLK
jgi:hypothetical protein